MAMESLLIDMEVDSNNEEQENEEFYENIEAPKFVDFTAPDHHRPDDRYWFCSRVGCDQKHEEEMDSEAIYKDFVIRVMAARSPNVRFQKALSRNASSKTMKYPLSAPPKSSKSRLSRLALISSISGKLVDDEGKVRPLPKLASTPKARTKQVAAKYLTTPRNRKCLPNPKSFRSVQNPKPTSSEVSQNRTVAKALIFHSPKKAITLKTSVELRTPLSKLCEGMKKLEITSQRKRSLGCSRKSSKNPGLGLGNSLRKKKVTFGDKSREKIVREQEAESSRSMKSKPKGNLKKQCQGIAENGSSGMKIDSKHKDNSEEQDHRTKKMSGKCGSIESKETGLCSEMIPATGTSDMMSSAFSRELESQSNSALREEDGCSRGNEQEKSAVDLKSGGKSNDHSTKDQTSDMAGHDSEVMDSDDKENASAFDQNRASHHESSETRKKGAQETPANIKKAAQEVDKNLKHAITGMKFKKPKPTNPRPFRLRTDERQILREANMEKALVDGKSQKKHEKNAQCQGDDQGKYNAEMPENSGKDTERTILSDLTLKGGRMKHNNPGGQEAPESAPTTPNRRQDSMVHLSKMKSPLKRDVVKHERISSTKATSSFLAPRQKLCVIKETSSPVAKPSKTVHRNESNDTTRIGGGTTASQPSWRRRPVTIPKEPNFHTIHRPRSSANK